MGDFQEAIHFYDKALKMADSNYSVDENYHGVIYHALGIGYKKLSKKEEALKVRNTLQI